jgi:hypothetical protein
VKKHLISGVICLFLFSRILAQQHFPVQATPVENILVALKSDSVILFMNAFSKELDSVTLPLSKWKERLNEGKRKFKRRYGDYEIKDFSYNYIDSTGQLQVFFKNKESFKILVIEEDNAWKLRQH